MTRPVALLVAVAVLSGCRGANPAMPVDPFGPTRVEPPRTGSVTVQPWPHSYHSGSPRAVAQSVAPLTQPDPDGLALSTKNRYDGAGATYNFVASSVEERATIPPAQPGDRIAIPSAAREFSDRSGSLATRAQADVWLTPAPDDGDTRTATAAVASGTLAASPPSVGHRRVPPRGGGVWPPHIPPTDGRWATPPGRSSVAAAEARPGTSLAGRERIVGTLQPQPTNSGASLHGEPSRRPAASGGHEPRRLVVPEGAIDIMDLPTPSTSSTTKGSATGSSGIRLVSGTEELDDWAARSSTIASVGQIDSFSPQARFGHDPNYGWLRGRLEYSHIDHHWKLRYIPIDGATDDFGGSVVLSNTPLLSGYERGEFVEVHGKLGSAPSDDRNYAPDFEIQQIRRLAE